MPLRQYLAPFGAASILWLSACTQQTSEAPQPSETIEVAVKPANAEPTRPRVSLQSPITTRKPGASVTFHADDIAMIGTGVTGTVTLTVHEGYPSGTLSLTASGDPGLSVFGTETEKQVNMSGQTSHTWRLNYSAETDGAYYIHLFAMAEPGDGTSISRSSAVLVKVGNWEAVEASAEAASNKMTLSDGEPAIMMDAEETIE